MSIQARLIQVGAGSIIVLASSLVYKYEGEVRHSYSDPVGILTACIGHTSPRLQPGQVFTESQCTELLKKDLTTANAAVWACLPMVPMKPDVEAALISFTLNVGKGALCSSTLAKKMRSGDTVGACNELSKWVYAKKRKLPGLVNRRAAERELCLRGAYAS
jgi:lysozyme